MTQFIELRDEVFIKLKKRADKEGVTPEVWLENTIREESKSRNFSKILDEEDKMHGDTED